MQNLYKYIKFLGLKKPVNLRIVTRLNRFADAEYEAPVIKSLYSIVYCALDVNPENEEEIECGQGRNTVVLKVCFLKKV